MKTWVGLLRGVNVGGANRLSMAALRDLCESLGWRGVRSVAASGNLVFRAAGEAGALAERLERAIADAHGFDLPVLVLPAAALRAALADCPFAGAGGSKAHAFFLWSDPVLDASALARLRAPSEVLIVRGCVAWLHAPDGIGRSKLVAGLHHVLTGTAMTGRNLNTLRKLDELLDDRDAR